MAACLRGKARKAGARGQLKTGAVTVIQRWGSALNLNVHFHTLFIDGVYAVGGGSSAHFFPTAAPTDEDVAQVASKVWRQVSKRLAANDEESAGTENDALEQITGALVRVLVATGSR